MQQNCHNRVRCRGYVALGIAMLLFVLCVSPVYSQDIQYDSTSLIFHYRGNHEQYYMIGQFISTLGDINGDRYDDIAVSANDPYGTMIFYGGEFPDSTPDMFIVGQNAIPVDLTGDGIDDLVTSGIYYVVGVPFSVIYFYHGYGDSLASQPYDSLRKDTDNYGFGMGISANYVDTDSLADLLVIQPNTPGGPTLHYYSGCPAIDTIPEWTWKIADYSHYISGPYPMGFVDFDGDSILDIYVGLRFDKDPDSVSSFLVFLGPDFGENPDIIIGSSAELESQYPFAFLDNGAYVLGDVDGDGWEDLGLLHSNKPLIYHCGPAADTIYDYILAGEAKQMAAAGDVNGDGYNDLVCGRTRTADGAVDIYLGGDDWDTIPDLSIDRLDLPRTSIYQIGRRVGTAGDFNGDGYDDFMFSARTNLQEQFGDVFVIKGGSWLATDVNDDTEEPAYTPSDPFLLSCYPNPFNSTVSIEFTLSRGEAVTLTIYNVLGQVIATLLDGSVLDQGSHKASWGTTSEGIHYPSGVYFVRLVSATSSTHRKVLLLK